jgi:GIY-YIG catalytic domain
MPVMFNYLLEQAGIDLRDVRFVRHQDGRTKGNRTPYSLFKHRYHEFMEYQSHQSLRNESYFGDAKYWAVFVVTPQRENLFVGLYNVISKCRSKVGTVVLGSPLQEEEICYELVLSEELKEYKNKLTIEWGKGVMNWIHRADQQKKAILSIRQNEFEPPFPGYLMLIEHLSAIDGLPDSWIGRLREAKGVYLLTCSKTDENYVGSATGEGGFYGRWQEHAAVGGDGVRFKNREPGELQVSILEVAGSGMTEADIVEAEYRWMKKLRPVLNGHTTLSGAP